MIQKQILETIKKNERFLVIAHINPEGDSIGSQLAMANLLRTMGKTVRIINEHSVPKNLMFLPGSDQIEVFSELNKEDINFDVAIILDCPIPERIGGIRNLLKGKQIIIIDHHISDQSFGDINWTDTKASSAGEMVYQVFKAAKVPLDDASAVCIYVAIMTDTGSFRYSNTTVATHHIIAELLHFDFSPNKVYEHIYETKSFEVMKLLSEVLSNLKRSADGRYVWFRVTDQMLKRNKLTAESTEDFIAFVRMIEGAEVVAYLREIENGSKVKISMRSKTDIDVNAIAGHFGGGGHKAASGCMIEANIDQAEEMLLNQIKKSIAEHNGKNNQEK
ncbi:MAG: bifunctional oligoribonuclease/PAP phosphatase NrnA [Candidatus Omnitrophica bacterium]|nr:bifunctional oligoribonuclease/PAP phosphatase NrnA [Candidatus Omnitrophota bacterium]